MSMYCTVQDVRYALAPIGIEARGNASATDLGTPQLQDAIQEASAIVDVYVGSRYVIGLVEVDQEGFTFDVGQDPVRWWTRDIAAYLATLSYNRNKEVPEDDPSRQRAARTMQMLEQVRSGALVLSTLEASVASKAGVSVYNITDQPLFPVGEFDIQIRTDLQRLVPRELWR